MRKPSSYYFSKRKPIVLKTIDEHCGMQNPPFRTVKIFLLLVADETHHNTGRYRGKLYPLAKKSLTVQYSN